MNASHWRSPGLLLYVLFLIGTLQVQNRACAQSPIAPAGSGAPSIGGDSMSTTSTAVPEELTPAQAASVSAKEVLSPGHIEIRQEFSADYSYVGGAQARAHADAGGAHYGDMDEQTSAMRYGLSVPLTASLALEGGVGYHRIDFGNPQGGSALPQSLQAITPDIGLRYRYSPDWSLFGRFNPEIEAVNDWNDSAYLRLTGAMGATWSPNPNLDLTFGLVINPGVADIPVMPLAAVRWHFANAWTLSLGFPKTAVEYQINKQWNVWAGPSFEGGLYKTGSNYGNSFGRPDLDNQRLQYQEIRVGIGSEYRLTSSIGLEGQVGSSVYREFDFKNTAYRVQVQPAPYAELGLKFHF
jgi:hypothetical protein